MRPFCVHCLKEKMVGLLLSLSLYNFNKGVMLQSVLLTFYNFLLEFVCRYLKPTLVVNF